jgi:hypothetical protein
VTKPTRALLFYLRCYIEEKPQRRKALCKFHLKRTERELHEGNLHRHLSLENQPNMDTTLVYLSFLHRAGELIPAEKRNGLFHYAHPEWLKK